MPTAIPPFKRLMAGYRVARNGCWEWQGNTYKNGYGTLKAFGKTISAHRLSYELHHGPILNGNEILHSCDNKKCVNPDHLKQGSHAENMAEAKLRGRMKKGESHPFYGVKQDRPKQSNTVLVMGKKYRSQKEAERELGLGSGTIRYWIKTNNTKAVLIRKAEQCREV